MAQIPSLLKSLRGKQVTYVARVLYEYAGKIEPEDGPLELGLDGEVLLFDGDADGERLRVRAGAWNDPFAEPLSAENRSYVATHGKWRRIDCSQKKPYVRFLGQTITDISMLVTDAGRIAGVRISVPKETMWFVVQGDESHVHWARPIGFTEQKV